MSDAAHDPVARAIASLSGRLEALEGLVKAILMTGVEPAPAGSPPPAPGREAPSGRHLVARVAGRLLGLPIDAVQHVARNAALSPVPGGGRALAGILDLRGAAVLVLGLRAALDAAPLEDDLDCRIVLITVGGRPYGLLVDEVLGVETVEAARLHPAPDPDGYVTGVLAPTVAAAGLIALVDPAALLVALRSGDAAPALEAASPASPGA